MARVVALLRGVNIGKRQLPMAALRAGLEAAECTDVATYVQSGNVVLTPPVAAGRQPAVWLSDLIGGIAGFDVPVVVRTRPQFDALVAANPFAGADGTRVHVVFCSAKVGQAVTTTEQGSERAVVAGSDVFLHVPDGMGRAQLPALVERDLKRAGIVGTARNWNTVEALRRMVSA